MESRSNVALMEPHRRRIPRCGRETACFDFSRLTGALQTPYLEVLCNLNKSIKKGKGPCQFCRQESRIHSPGERKLLLLTVHFFWDRRRQRRSGGLFSLCSGASQMPRILSSIRRVPACFLSQGPKAGLRQLRYGLTPGRLRQREKSIGKLRMLDQGKLCFPCCLNSVLLIPRLVSRTKYGTYSLEIGLSGRRAG